jgi:hypothetical protein
MKKIALVLLLVAGFLALAVTPGYTWGHGHWHGGVFIGVGPFWGPYPYYWYPPPPPYYYSPPVVVEQPQVYVEQQPPPAPPPAPSAPPAYWYYCQSAKGYYPTVPSCPEEWVKVPERPQ